MSGNAIFNATVCIIGIAILLIHVVNASVKKHRRKDENWLLSFLLFTVIHFATYLAFTLIKVHYTSNAYVMGFYTTFYIFNNAEILLLSFYAFNFVNLKSSNRKILSITNLALFAVFVVLDLINIFTGMFFTAVDGEYVRASTMIFSQIYQFIMFAVVFIVTVFNKNLVIREKIAFALYCILPLVAIILQNIFKGYAIAYASIIIAIEILFFFVNVRKNIQLAEEQKKSNEAQIKVMMSQIQPHFIYNSLSSISTLITIDPNRAQEALDNFTEYLRTNLTALTETNLVPFKDELRHIQTYVSLEKVRFNDRLNVKYDIQVIDFKVPPLSIQPLVENAIKHGILKKIEGGTVSISTHETNKAYIVEIVDDGVGFDIESVNFSNNKHIGLNNIRYRLKSMCGADITFESDIGKGTRVVVTYYK